MIGIYKITNLVTGKSYIGQSVNIEKRFRQHLSDKAKGHGKLFSEELKKYGKAAFSLQILQECSRSELTSLERKYIHEFQPEYNEVVHGSERSDEFKKKVSDGVKEWWTHLDTETADRIKKNLTGPAIGHEVSTETKEKLRAANLGKKQPKETIDKRRRSLEKRVAEIPKDGSGHYKKVGCDIDGLEFESVKGCAEYFEVHPSTVTKALKRGSKVKGHKVWYVV